MNSNKRDEIMKMKYKYEIVLSNENLFNGKNWNLKCESEW